MTTSYEELTPESREQVDAFMSNVTFHMSELSEFDINYMREHVSNLVQTCIYIEKKGDNKAVILTSREWKSLSRAYLNLHELLLDMPSYLGDYFQGREQEFRDMRRWAEKFEEEKKPINKRRGR